MVHFIFNEETYLAATPPGLFGTFLYRLDFYGGFDVDRGRDFLIPNLAQAFLPFEGEVPYHCADLCGASVSCHGFVTSKHVCYFRGGEGEKLEHMLEKKVEASGVVLYLLTPIMTVSDVLNGLLYFALGCALLALGCTFKRELGACRHRVCKRVRGEVRKTPLGASCLSALDSCWLRFLEGIFWVKYYVDHYIELALDWLTEYVWTPYIVACWRHVVIKPCQKCGALARPWCEARTADTAACIRAGWAAFVRWLTPQCQALGGALGAGVSAAGRWVRSKLPPAWLDALSRMQAWMQATREQCWAALPSGFRRWCTTVWGGSRDKLYKAIPASLWSNGCFGCVCSCVVRDRERRIRLYRQLQEEEEMQSLATKRGGLMQRTMTDLFDSMNPLQWGKSQASPSPLGAEQGTRAATPGLSSLPNTSRRLDWGGSVMGGGARSDREDDGKVLV
mmetsp:Transcript_76184/g.202446  ORF Transcript_76184/g.202446 Transcript_76184/m.202446 type:complete len:449 (+) Transcript_76184:126-1472(+)